MRTQWNDAEDAALHGLPWVAQLLYLRAIRPYMDYATGIVGIKRGISLKSLSEMLHVEPMQGRKDAGDPSQKAIRHALDLLERAGLIARLSADRQLIFKLPLADTDSSVSEKRGRFGADLGQTKQGRPNACDNKDLGDMWGRFEADPEPEKRGTPPVSGNPEELGMAKAIVESGGFDGGDASPKPATKATPVNASVESLPVRAVFDYWRDVMDHPGAKLDSKRRTAISARLKAGYSVANLKAAIDGCRSSDWHMGKNDGGKVYDDIELICRNASKVEMFMQRATKKSKSDLELEAWLSDSDASDNIIEGVCQHV